MEAAEVALLGGREIGGLELGEGAEGVFVEHVDAVDGRYGKQALQKEDSTRARVFLGS